jgi:hypothetical protein
LSYIFSTQNRLFSATPAGSRESYDFRYRRRRANRWQTRKFGGFLRVVHRSGLVSSPYAYQKASWLVPAKIGPAPILTPAELAARFAPDQARRAREKSEERKPAAQDNQPDIIARAAGDDIYDRYPGLTRAAGDEDRDRSR